MTRSRPVDPPDIASLNPPRDPLLTVDISVVTPMFGGGPSPGDPDPACPIHGATVRGHLRFWWRACRGVRFSSSAELFQHEAAIWGQAATTPTRATAPSAVDIAVEILKAGTVVEPTPGPRGAELAGSLPAYAVFPFQRQAGGGGEGPRDARRYLRDVAFRLHFFLAPHARGREPEIGQAVDDALWAWVTFGGIGARTRRGCGALYSDRYAPGQDVERWLQQQASQRVTRGRRQLPIAALTGARAIIGRSSGNSQPTVAWSTAVGWLQGFRQGADLRVARPNPNRPGRTRPGRSPWPEADSVREMLGTDGPRGQHRQSHQPFFPRADLGLPIIFQQMPGSPRIEAAADGASRLASPIIVKPLALAPDRALPLVLSLNAPNLWQMPATPIKLRSTRGDRTIEPAMLHDPARSASVPPLRGETTARDAFLRYARSQGSYTEVIL